MNNTNALLQAQQQHRLTPSTTTTPQFAKDMTQIPNNSRVGNDDASSTVSSLPDGSICFKHLNNNIVPLTPEEEEKPFVPPLEITIKIRSHRRHRSADENVPEWLCDVKQQQPKVRQNNSNTACIVPENDNYGYFEPQRERVFLQPLWTDPPSPVQARPSLGRHSWRNKKKNNGSASSSDDTSMDFVDERMDYYRSRHQHFDMPQYELGNDEEHQDLMEEIPSTEPRRASTSLFGQRRRRRKQKQQHHRHVSWTDNSIPPLLSQSTPSPAVTAAPIVTPATRRTTIPMFLSDRGMEYDRNEDLMSSASSSSSSSSATSTISIRQGLVRNELKYKLRRKLKAPMRYFKNNSNKNRLFRSSDCLT